ncbi:MAG TPA: GNAT family N-acetyltransferase [Casimicrobiaceae bacterium]|nr:GNAT family N-acetyltransferase [Casimicrobiaceae bacterium]
MNRLTKKLANLVVGDYSAYHIYSFAAGNDKAPDRYATRFRFASVGQAEVEASHDPTITERASYHGPETYAYACFDGARIVGVCYFWYGAQYRKRNFWPLGDSEAKLVELVTVPDMRARGVATHLIVHAAADMLAKGFSRLFARIWHSNKASVTAFRRAGWARVAIVIEIHPLRRRLPLRITLRQRYA